MIHRDVVRFCFFVIALCLILFEDSNSFAGTLVAGSSLERTLYDIDSSNGKRGSVFEKSTNIGSAGPAGLAFNSRNGFLYFTTRVTQGSGGLGRDQSVLYRALPQQLESNPDSVPRNIQASTADIFEFIRSYSVRIEGLAFDSMRNVLWGSDQFAGNIYEISPETGTLELRFNIPRGPIIGGIAGLAYDHVSDRLYAVDDSVAEGTQLYVVDIEADSFMPAGANTEVIRLADGTTFRDIDGLTYDTDKKVLWGIVDSDSNGFVQQLIQIDPITKIAITVGEPSTEFRPNRGVDSQGLAFITPEPSVATLLLTGIAMASIRRRQV